MCNYMKLKKYNVIKFVKEQRKSQLKHQMVLYTIEDVDDILKDILKNRRHIKNTSIQWY